MHACTGIKKMGIFFYYRELMKLLVFHFCQPKNVVFFSLYLYFVGNQNMLRMFSTQEMS